MSLTTEQQEIHATGIGASEIAAIVGRNPWASPFDVWQRKPGPNRLAVLEDDFETDEERGHKEVGSVLEASLIELHRRRHPGTPVHHVSHRTERHPEYPWVIASPDGFDGPADGPIDALLELKVVGVHMADYWTAGVPDFVTLQAQWQAFTCRHRFGEQPPRVYVLRLSGTDYLEYVVEYDEPLVQELYQLARTFWFDYVQTDTPPPIGAMEDRSDYLQKRFPRPKLGFRSVPEEDQPKVDIMVDRYRRAQVAYAKAKDEIEVAHDDLCEYIGDGSEGIYGPWGKAIWKTMRGQVSYKSL